MWYNDYNKESIVSYCSDTNTRKFKARIRLPSGDVTVVVRAQNQAVAIELVRAQYGNVDIIGNYVGPA